MSDVTPSRCNHGSATPTPCRAAPTHASYSSLTGRVIALYCNTHASPADKPWPPSPSLPGSIADAPPEKILEPKGGDAPASDALRLPSLPHKSDASVTPGAVSQPGAAPDTFPREGEYSPDLATRKWTVYVGCQDSLDEDHLRLALQEAYTAGVSRERAAREEAERDWRKLLLLVAEACGEEDPQAAVEDDYDPWEGLRKHILAVVLLRSAHDAALERLRTAEAEISITKRAADRLADEVAVLVHRKVIDARSPAGDALLDYRDPPSTERADRIAKAEAELERVRGALRACRYGDGCLCSGGPYVPERAHSARCLAWQRAVGAPTPYDLPAVFSSPPAPDVFCVECGRDGPADHCKTARHHGTKPPAPDAQELRCVDCKGPVRPEMVGRRTEYVCDRCKLTMSGPETGLHAPDAAHECPVPLCPVPSVAPVICKTCGVAHDDEQPASQAPRRGEGGETVSDTKMIPGGVSFGPGAKTTVTYYPEGSGYLPPALEYAKLGTSAEIALLRAGVEETVTYLERRIAAITFAARHTGTFPSHDFELELAGRLRALLQEVK